VLLGPNKSGRVIRSQMDKPVEIDSIVPRDVGRFPWAGHLGLSLVDEVIAALDKARSTLLFTNTRSQAELWYRAIVERRLDWLTNVALHHGSVDRKLRARIEQAVKTGELRCVVCTSSLDLGVDFAPVDQVIQVGSPKGIGRLMQRAGRSGHRPGETSRVLCVPTHAWELVEIAAAREATGERRIEPRRPLRRSLDVLVQHCVTLAAGPGFEEEALLAEVRDTHAFAELSDAEWRWVMDFITRGGTALQGYPQYRRVVKLEGLFRVADNRLARHHRMSIGTISSDTEMLVKWSSGGTLGTVEESFISRLKPGDHFLFAGRTLRLVQVKDMTAYVKASKGKRGELPRWQGGRLPLSVELADAVLEVLAAYRQATHESSDESRVNRPPLAKAGAHHSLKKARDAGPAPDIATLISSGVVKHARTLHEQHEIAAGVVKLARSQAAPVDSPARTLPEQHETGQRSADSKPESADAASRVAAIDAEPVRRVFEQLPELRAVAPLLDLQARWSAIPGPETLLVERLRSREGYHLYVYPFCGRLANEGIATLVAARWAQRTPQTFTVSANDYGFEVLSPSEIPVDEDGLRAVLSAENLGEDLLTSVNLAEISRRQFRDIARIAGLVFQGFPGSGKSTRQLQASSSLIFDVLREYDPANLLLRQARMEVLEAQLELSRIAAALSRLANRRIVMREPVRLTPLAFPLWAGRLQTQTISTESWQSRIERAARELEAYATGANE
jgi:ATP-dependent helicase Lhr and Lhr-like helicase